MAEQIALTASNIRYLLKIKELGESGHGARCVDIAASLGLSKPSVSNMLGTFINMGLVNKNSYGAAYLTKEGSEAAERYGQYYESVSALLGEYFPGIDNVENLACLLLSEIPEESLAGLYDRYTAVSGKMK